LEVSKYVTKMTAQKPKYTDGQLKRLLTDIHSGVITEMNLPEPLYKALGEYYTKAVYQGFGNTLKNVSTANEELLTDLRENVWLFSAAKTYQFTKAATDALTDENGKIQPFNKFYAQGQDIAGTYLDSWAKAEYTTAIGQSQMAKQWASIEANKDILPMLTFSTDGNACPECDPFDGLTAPVDNPIWDVATPLLHFNCMCILIPSDDATPWEQSKIDDLPVDDNIPEDFQNNPGKTGEIFPPSHPYFEDVPKGEAKRNFGFNVPEND